MSRDTTLLAALLATVLAVPSVALADAPMEEVALNYSKITFPHEAAPAKRPESTNNLKQLHLASHDRPAAPGDVVAPTDAQPIGMPLPAVQAAREPARSQPTPPLTAIDPLPAKLDGGGSEGVRKGAWILDTSRLDPAALPSKPKEIVVVGSKPSTGLDAARDLSEIKARVDRNLHRPATPPAAIVAPAPKPPYTPIELLPLKGRR